jgi:hypothetical protein
LCVYIKYKANFIENIVGGILKELCFNLNLSSFFFVDQFVTLGHRCGGIMLSLKQSVATRLYVCGPLQHSIRETYISRYQ